jgi:hypothetical protein
MKLNLLVFAIFAVVVMLACFTTVVDAKRKRKKSVNSINNDENVAEINYKNKADLDKKLEELKSAKNGQSSGDDEPSEFEMDKLRREEKEFRKNVGRYTINTFIIMFILNNIWNHVCK